MSELESQYVKKGFWVNLSHGPIMGQTITTDAQTGAIVVALLAVITSLGMTHLWHLLTFFHHQLRANGKPRDGLFRHQQALLRTLPGPSSMVADSVKLWYAWRGVSDGALGRSLIQIGTALFFVAASLVASTFSSLIVDNTNLEVLVQSPHCGSLNRSLESDNEVTAYLGPVFSAADDYAPDCYRNGSLPSRCGIFSRPKIDFKTEEVPCPFDAKMCNSSAISLDSGIIDVNDAFGFNFGQSDRLRYRKKTTCSILPLDGYKVISDVSEETGIPETLRIAFYYGGLDIDPPRNYSWATRMSPNQQVEWNAPFTKVSVTSYANREAPFQPMPELQRDDGDVTILFVMNAAEYLEPVDDPLFGGHEAAVVNTTAGQKMRYFPDHAHSAIGCFMQLDGLPPSTANANILPGASPVQLAVLELLAQYGNLGSMIAVDSFITTRQAIGGASIRSLPKDQWVKELQYWEAWSWTVQQIALSDHAIGVSERSPLLRKEAVAVPENGYSQLCGLQKMRKQGGFRYVFNINFFAMVFTIVMASVFVITDLTLLRFLSFLLKYKRSLGPRLDRWIHDGIFQLERRAHEAQGHGAWKNLEEEIPVTRDKCLLEDLTTDTVPYDKFSSPFSPMHKTHTGSSKEQKKVPRQVLRTKATWKSDETLGDDAPTFIQAIPKM
ncbi:hypothetical protein M011DRAFT_403849 [Sporormia fimetaria CBS 119925]|uniref:Uncharacterized protein n=1 Tax=Sporormia fimetaria CBS 119925 TaxID=1340428 RepID=A0A6A6VA72_9PLEO|nr:hypothetical protein M011DRAFT_403849 [Sporormia fimetaria CBS 119925]